MLKICFCTPWMVEAKEETALDTILKEVGYLGQKDFHCHEGGLSQVFHMDIPSLSHPLQRQMGHPRALNFCKSPISVSSMEKLCFPR